MKTFIVLHAGYDFSKFVNVFKKKYMFALVICVSVQCHGR